LIRVVDSFNLLVEQHFDSDFKVIPGSEVNNRMLNSMLAEAELGVPDLDHPPALSVAPALSEYSLPGTDNCTAFRGDFNDAFGRGHFARIFTVEGHEELAALDYRTFCSVYGRPTEDLTVFWELARTGKGYAACLEMAEVVSCAGPDFMDWLIDKHTDKVAWSPFVSTTFDPETAALYAPRHYGTMSVFEVTLTAESVIVDINDIGKTGEAAELLAFGWIPAQSSRLHQ
jgi:hypothetical protein